MSDREILKEVEPYSIMKGVHCDGSKHTPRLLVAEDLGTKLLALNLYGMGLASKGPERLQELASKKKNCSTT